MEDNNNNNEVANIFNYSDYTYDIPRVAKAWLDKYGITKGEILSFNLLWNEQTDSLCFPVFGSDDKVKVTCERYFGSNPLHPKYLVNGHKNQNYLFALHTKNEANLVFTEDFVSAIKVARHVSACPLLGATIGMNAVQAAVHNFKAVRVWLDFDKATESLQQASKMSQFLPDTKSIITPLDPKEYTNNELINILKEHGVA